MQDNSVEATKSYTGPELEKERSTAPGEFYSPVWVAPTISYNQSEVGKRRPQRTVGTSKSRMIKFICNYVEGLSFAIWLGSGLFFQLFLRHSLFEVLYYSEYMLLIIRYSYLISTFCGLFLIVVGIIRWYFDPWDRIKTPKIVHLYMLEYILVVAIMLPSFIIVVKTGALQHQEFYYWQHQQDSWTNLLRTDLFVTLTILSLLLFLGLFIIQRGTRTQIFAPPTWSIVKANLEKLPARRFNLQKLYLFLQWLFYSLALGSSITMIFIIHDVFTNLALRNSNKPTLSVNPSIFNDVIKIYFISIVFCMIIILIVELRMKLKTEILGQQKIIFKLNWFLTVKYFLLVALAILSIYSWSFINKLPNLKYSKLDDQVVYDWTPSTKMPTISVKYSNLDVNMVALWDTPRNIVLLTAMGLLILLALLMPSRKETRDEFSG